MNSEQILDSDFNSDFQKYLFENEEIIWEGCPDSTIRIMLLETKGTSDNRTGPFSFSGLIFIVLIITGFNLYSSSDWIGVVLIIIIGLLLFLLPDVMKNIRKNKTKYSFTRNRVFFKLWKFGRESIHIMDLGDVNKITYEAFKDKSGVIHFFPNKPVNFSTHDFFSGKKRFYPTFELVPDVISLSNELEQCRKERIKSKNTGNPA